MLMTEDESEQELVDQAVESLLWSDMDVVVSDRCVK